MSCKIVLVFYILAVILRTTLQPFLCPHDGVSIRQIRIKGSGASSAISSLLFCVKEALSQREIDTVESIFRYSFAISNLSSHEYLTLDTFFSSSVRCPIFVNQCIISMAIVSLSDNLGGGHAFFIYL